MAEIIMEYLGDDCIICHKLLSKGEKTSICCECSEKLLGLTKFSEEVEDIETLRCPRCDMKHKPFEWEQHTLSLQPLDVINQPRITIPRKIHSLLGTVYSCPSCNHYARGVDLIVNN